MALALVAGIVAMILILRRPDPPPPADTATDSANTADTATAATTATVPPLGETPDFTARQGHLDPAPTGVDARYAWTQPGGDGTGVRVGIVTEAVKYVHEDLGTVSVPGKPADDGWRDQTLAAHGIIAAKNNGFGVTGIAPAASVSFHPMTHGTARAIVESAEGLRAGDVLLVMVGRQGGTEGRRVPIEWWPNEFAAIRQAADLGVIVVETAGNDRADLDSPSFDTPEDAFPPNWKNPFGKDAAADSGAIVVGAGLPNHLAATRFSNYGARVDVHAQGADVVTTGTGDLFGAGDPARSYTAEYGGTSASAAIVAGVLASVQGVLRAKGLAPLTPAEARRLLRETGSRPATPAQGRRIGPRPDLRKLIPAALALRR